MNETFHLKLPSGEYNRLEIVVDCIGEGDSERIKLSAIGDFDKVIAWQEWERIKEENR